jgi:membrane protein DedA with SNARE-associated domain
MSGEGLASTARPLQGQVSREGAGVGCASLAATISSWGTGALGGTHLLLHLVRSRALPRILLHVPNTSSQRTGAPHLLMGFFIGYIR